MTVLNPLPFEIDRAAVAQALHIKPGSRAAAEVDNLIAEAQQVARPKALYKLSFIDARDENSVRTENITFNSRILRVNLGDLQRFFPFVVTSGRECEDWATCNDDPVIRFYADVINQAVLRSATTSFGAHISEAFALPHTSVMNPGSLPEWPITQQKPLFALLGDVEGQIGVNLTPSYLMLPTKSVSGILFPTEESFASCQLCPREGCPNRRAPYDAALFARKYEAAEVAADSGVVSGMTEEERQ